MTYETSYGELLYANPEVAVAVAMFDYFARDSPAEREGR
jgi:hypothetical protein